MCIRDSLNGSAFREQVLDYMEQTYGISIVRDLAGMTGVWEEQELKGEEIKRQDAEWLSLIHI